MGDKDNVTPVTHQKMLYDKIPGEKEIHILKDETHNIIDLAKVKTICTNWIKSL
jgi:hypothetical protein